MSYERLKPQLTFAQHQLEELKKIAPEAFADGKINWETLKEALGEYLEDEGAEAEHFGLFWHGKREARRIAAIPSKGTLVPVPGEGVDEEKTRNIFIEGENLEVLKLLQKSYAGRIKMIYIDPPYNTGNDFVYEDDFREPLEEYLRRTGQVDEEGKPWTTNTRADGRFHSKWLSMMYPRLKLAATLLKDDGVIFVSIDDNEMHNLRQLMSEIFGEENYLATIVWQHSVQPKGYLEKFSVHHSYILSYSKSNDFDLIPLERTAEHNRNYSNPDNDPKGPWRSGDVRNALFRRNLIYDLVTPSGKIIKPPPKGWRWSKETMEAKIKTGEIIFTPDESKIVRKIYLKNVEGRAPESIWFAKDVGTTREAAGEVKDLFDGVAVFETPKAVRLISALIKLSTEKKSDDLVLDFVAGSGTTAEPVCEINRQDGGRRTFVLVQLQEETNKDSTAYKAGYKTVSDICKDRIARASKKFKKEKADGDFGFKTLRLSKSNYKIWQDYDGTNLAELEAKLDLFETPLVDNWKSENLLTEILILEGFPLDSRIEKLKDHKVNTVHNVSSEFCEHRLLVCLDSKVEHETIQHLKFGENDVFVCLDSALSDQDKMRLADVCKLKAI